ncbi:outer spore coat protein CotE [Bacillaceae bacterium SIJ1]|uniref:outer spore coat protein CotE n=1 Tax=Litoribacterium kuwaitense TaxID=1398745 RepID=UPI0013EDD70D|nr:outer spore coat protein CotE [Litoribacterium kuwaitense]NGP44058.1 outer spore coat protein CotE [Litoribacterium kuwaitense]
MAKRGQTMKYREVITKAVCGKGKKFTQTSHSISPQHRPTSILGCWIINHRYEAKKRGDVVVVDGRYDVNIWYSCENNTKTQVCTETISYTDEVPLKVKDEEGFGVDEEVIARVLQQPNCLEANISERGNKVLVEVEREFLVEIIGDTKVRVTVHPDSRSDDDWQKVLEEESFEDLDTDFLSTEEE